MYSEASLNFSEPGTWRAMRIRKNDYGGFAKFINLVNTVD